MAVACARQSSPTGGAVDSDPPQPVVYNPPQFTTHFDKKGFVIEFDEYVKLDGMSSQLIISPPLSKLPEYAIRGKRLLINWDDTLQANATYQFNFGSAVVDVNEGNANNDLVYVFSTGSYIDSLLVAGSVTNSADNTPLEGAAVMLYKETADSLPLTRQPDYFSMTDEEGKFIIKYLPEGEFKIFVLKEEQKNYKYNGPPETIAFLDNRVWSTQNDSVGLIQLRAFVEEDTNQYISARKETDYGYYEVVFNKQVAEPEIVFTDIESKETIDAIAVLNQRRDTLKAWVNLPDRTDLDEVAVYIHDGDQFADTAFWYLETNPKFKQKSEFKTTTNISGGKLDLLKPLTLEFNHPLTQIDTALITFVADSIEMGFDKTEQSRNDRKISFFYAFKPEERYHFKALPGAFTDVFGAINDTVSVAFALRDNEYYGSLDLKIFAPDHNDPNEQKILLFTDSKGKIVEERFYTQNFSETFKLLPPGKYQVKVIFDANGNGKWDTGVYRDHIQPEKQSIYPEEIEVRSNWEFDLEWTPVLPESSADKEED